MPAFLHDCFDGRKFQSAFGSDIKLKEWIEKQNLHMFFNDHIHKENIIDLHGTRNVKENIPVNADLMLDNYIDILKNRTKALKSKN